MQQIDVTDLNPRSNPRNSESVSRPLEADDFAMNYYVLEPGEEFSGSLHTHLDQEESFFILEGEATFERQPTPTAESETVTVSEGEMIRFEPGEYQQGRNEGDDEVRALAMGTPQQSADVRAAEACPECGDNEYLDFVMSDGQPALECPECGTHVEI
jgi:mannose-6-phosphate isomerase-like protein (cupin superfamily)